MIELDGSYGEGGGQILRNAAAFAAILGKDLGIRKIRAGRSKPGLRRQHLTGLELLADCCGGTLEGGSVGSQEIVFRMPPSIAKNGESSGQQRVLTGDTQTAGSICLLLQAVFPFALLCTESIHWVLKGGTNAAMAPQYDYWELLFLPVLKEQLGLRPKNVQATVIRRGFFPRGGGEVHVHTTPGRDALRPISLTERGGLVCVEVRSYHAGKCPRKVAVQMANAAKELLDARLGGSVVISTNIAYLEPAAASGSGILIIATTSTGCRLGGSALGSPKVAPQRVGVQAAEELCATLEDGGCVDEYLQDQLILYMALARGTSEMITGSITCHSRTAIWTAEQCCGAQFQIEGLDDKEAVTPDSNGRISGRHRIRCTGIGFSPC